MLKFAAVSAVSFYAGYRFRKFVVRLGKAVDILAEQGIDFRKIPIQGESVVCPT